ncbi:MAG: SRPBCC family protein [Verrucomicrobia bacterium]|nr:SRPBCC family protein [Verrucomicrobiota bacterium]
MAIKIEKSFQLANPPDEVWQFLSNPQKVATCVPGSRVTEQVDERTYRGVIKVQVGPAVTDYKGEVHIERLEPEKREIEMIGKGQDVRGKGSATMKMTGLVHSLPNGGSEIVTVSEVSVVGLLAQLGARMIQEVANRMFDQFTANFRNQLERERSGSAPAGTEGGSQTAEPEPIKALPLVASVTGDAVKGVVRRIFGGGPPQSSE